VSSDKQIAANRLNAKRSTGPHTSDGKARVSVNALKHGLTGRDVALPGEDPDDFESFRGGLLTNLDPQGDLETFLAEKIAADAWRLRRVPIFEAALYRRISAERLVKQEAESVQQYELTDDERALASLRRTEVADDDRQAHEDAQQRLESARNQLNVPFFKTTHVLETAPEPFKNLWRHEAALSRSMFRTLHELERLRAKRAGEHVSVPAVVDVDV
jgi:hypothetical protein